MKRLQAVRGMNDYFAEDLVVWRRLEHLLRDLVERYGYGEVLTPVVEPAELFIRSVGESSDIVSKEMYMFEDRNGDQLVLRPEGTASCIRAGLEHGKFYNQRQKWYYFEPMFRHERPQRGRYRQFYQFGVEAYGYSEVALDAEILQMIESVWSILGLAAERAPTLHLNSLGNIASRARYRQALVEYFTRYQNDLDEDAKRCLVSNPLRIVDSKNPAMQELIKDAPSILDYLDTDSAARFEQLQDLLQAANIAYQVDPRLVRGLDYYNDTVFEWMVTGPEGGSIAACAGGRYDQLIESMGGKDTPAIGFAFGFERLLSLVDTVALLEQNRAESAACGCYLIAMHEKTLPTIMRLTEALRAHGHRSVEMDYATSNLKNQLKRASRSGARWAIMAGTEELDKGKVLVKDLTDGAQKLLSVEEALELVLDR